jgi:tRNA nucleotidyltransferase (CCA-adding enzyme)
MTIRGVWLVVSIVEEIERVLPEDLLRFITAAGELVAAKGQSLYLVGGAVRDLFLGRSNLDLDLVVEGDAPSLARQIARQKGMKVVTHPHFGTATISIDNASFDIVTARSESYFRPGALPAVKPGTIRDDLYRRDFTINAMAAHLHPERFGELVDPYDGKGDLDRGLIRVLHGDSFRDDPTRIWRAIRYEQRLGFRLEPETESLLRRDLAVMDAVSGDRLRHELERILKEDEPEKAVNRAYDLGVLQRLTSSLQGNGWISRRFERARQASPDLQAEPVVYLALLAWRLDKGQIEAFIERLNFDRGTTRVLRQIPPLKEILQSLEAPDLRPSEIYHRLERYRAQAILTAALATDSEPVHRRLALYLSSLRAVSPSLNGDDLKRMGVPPGRKLGGTLRALIDARLDGVVTSREEEEALVRRWLSGSKR